MLKNNDRNSGKRQYCNQLLAIILFSKFSVDQKEDFILKKNNNNNYKLRLRSMCAQSC